LNRDFGASLPKSLFFLTGAIAMNKTFIKKILSSEKGATAVEYGLIAALIVIATIGALTSMSDTFVGNLNTTSATLTGAMNNY
jgi:pilus assembly protein Flp/PilA